MHLAGFSLIGAVHSSLARGTGVYLTGASTSCVERLISLAGLIQVLIGDIANKFIPADETLHHVFIIFVSPVCWIHTICKLKTMRKIKNNKKRA